MSDDTSAASTPGSSLVRRLTVVAFMGMVVAVETTLAYLWIPSADEVLKKTETDVAKATEEASDKEEPLAVASVAVAEVELGQFSITAPHPASNATLRVEFTLVGTVREEDRKRLEEKLEKHRHRLRDLVLVEIRTAEIADLTDPGLGLIKRRLLEKTNALLGEPILRSVIFSDYTYFDE